MSLQNFDLADLRKAIISLRRHASDPVDSLKGAVKRDFETVKRYTTLLYGTPGYEILYNMIKEHFSNIDDPNIHSVGNHFGGCVDAEMDGCSLSCLGNVPSPNTPFCAETVVMALIQKDGYHFTIKNSNANNGNARLYLPEYRGFSRAEKQYLRNQGIDIVALKDYRENPIYVNGTDLYSVDDLPERTETEPMADYVETDDKTMLVLVLIVVFVLVLFISTLIFSRSSM